MTPTQRALRFAIATVCLVAGGYLFPVTKYETYLAGMAVGIGLIYVYQLALRMEAEE